MAINNVSGTTQYVPQQINPQQTKIGKDADGDNDGTKAGQVEKSNESGKATEVVKVKPTTETSGTSGRNINTFA